MHLLYMYLLYKVILMLNIRKMSGFNISGIQQLGIGTTDFRKSWNWYIEMFGADVRILEDDSLTDVTHA